MAVPANVTKQADYSVTARELEFVTQFKRNWDALQKLMGIMKPIRKALGTRLVSYKASVNLQSGDVAEGDEIPYSKATVEEVAYKDVTHKKWCKGVTLESVTKWGANIAIRKTDEELRNEITNYILTNFYTFLNTGALVGAATTWQAQLATAKALVLDKFNRLRRTVTEVVGFANILDAYAYLGEQSITVQTMFGVSYVENFLGYKTLFLLSSPDIARGKVIACPVNNIDLYYVDPSDAEIRALGLDYTVAGETNLVGFATEGVLKRATGDVYAITAMVLWAEYLNGIAVVDLGTESFTAVATPTGNPSTSNYFEKDGDAYVKSADTAVVTGKTYYTRTLTQGA